MIRFHAVCETCRRDLFRKDDVAAAYRLRGGVPEDVDLGDRCPWSGVRCVCVRCRDFVARYMGGISHAEA